MLKLKYLGQEKSRSKQQSSYKETWYGTETEVDEKVSTLDIGSYSTGKGYLSSWRKSQLQASIYQLELDYTVSYDNQPDNLDETDVGKFSATLSVRNLQLPLEHHPDYRACWNHYLYVQQGYSLPDWWSTAINIEDEEDGYQWSKYPDLPKIDSEGIRWKLLKEPIKKGTEVYDWACYVVTESAKYRSAESAGSAIQKKVNTIVAPENDFGITGGNWKLDEVSVSYTGKYWVATSVYTRSGDENGWDADLYPDPTIEETL